MCAGARLASGGCAVSRRARGGRRSRFAFGRLALVGQPLLAGAAAGSRRCPGAGGGAAASSSRVNASCHASCRFRHCERVRAHDATTTGPTAASTRSRTTAGSPVRSTSMVTVTAVSEVFACCPPGPPLRVACHSMASARMRRPCGVRWWPSTGFHQSSCCIVAHRPCSCSRNTSISAFSRVPLATTARPLWCTSSISSVAFSRV